MKISLGFDHVEGFTSETSGLQTKRYSLYDPVGYIFALIFFIVILLSLNCTKERKCIISQLLCLNIRSHRNK